MTEAELPTITRDANGAPSVDFAGAAQPEAIALYESAGYEPVEKFGHYAWSPLSRCFGKRL